MLSLTCPARTVYHGIAAGRKLTFLLLFTMVLYLFGEPWLVAAAFLLVAALHVVPGWWFLFAALRWLRPLVWFLAVVLIWNAAGGEYLMGIVTGLKLVAAVALANLVTMTTRLDDMLALLRRLMEALPLPKRHGQALALSIALVVRFIPVMTEKARLLMDAWKCRSTKRAGWRVIPSLACMAFDDAGHVAAACRARGGTGEGLWNAR